jgi:hypothetical protein
MTGLESNYDLAALKCGIEEIIIGLEHIREKDNSRNIVLVDYSDYLNLLTNRC